ncbi:MAG TPA: FAD-dependent oxidoreductase [Pseudonocardia sp.]|nr:FAD-dependent oxidoreductase [Pseudonocardia sp.]
MSAPKVLVLGAGVAGLTTAIALGRRGIAVDVLERDRPRAPSGRRAAGSWYRDGVPHAGQGHVFSPRCHRVLASELPDVLRELVQHGARELAVGRSAGRWDGPEADASGTALAVRRPVFDWVLRRVAEREPSVRVHSGVAATGLRTSGGRLSGVLVGGGVLETDLAVDATGAFGPVSEWLDDLGHRGECPWLVEPRPDPDTPGPVGADYFTRSYALHWSDELPGELNLGLAAGGDFGGYSCRVVPGDNNTFTVMFTVPVGPGSGSSGSADAPVGAGLAALATPDGFQLAASRIPLVAGWVDAMSAEPLSGVTPLRLPPARRGGAADVARLPGLVAVGDALHTGDPVWCSGVAVALTSGLACARAVRAVRDGETVDIAARVWSEAADLAEYPACACARVPGPSAAELAALLGGTVAGSFPVPVG